MSTHITDNSVRWPAPGKLNLLLKIVGQRADGYHLLQTVFQFIDYCDWLVFKPRSDGQIKLEKPLPGHSEQDDLTVRAAKLLREASGCHQGVTIAIEKNLPMGGGLGGGSSDAATTLVVLNRLWDTGYNFDQLADLGVSLGADVPVFVRGQSAWAEGVGEKLKPMTLPTPWYLVIIPPVHVSTKDVFSVPDLTRDSMPVTMADFVSGCHDNDCLAVVTSRYKPVKEALKALSSYGEARLTGTGASVFAAFEDQEQARMAARELSQKWRLLVVKGVNRSPLMDLV